MHTLQTAKLINKEERAKTDRRNLTVFDVMKKEITEAFKEVN